MPPEPPSPLHWVFHSPMRLVGVSLLVAGTVVACVLVASATQQDTQAAAPPAARPASPHVPTSTPPMSGPSPTETVDGSQRSRISAAARTFVGAWVANGPDTSRTMWLRTIRPLTTGSLYRGLEATDPDRLPGGQVERAQLERIGPFAATAVVTLTSGLQVQVELVTERGAWVVADLRAVGT